LLLVALMASIPAQAQQGAPQPGSDGVLRVCSDPNNLPFSNQKEEGFENRIAELLAREMGLKLEYAWFPQRMGFIRATLRNNETEDGSYKCDYVMGVVENFELAATTRPYMRSTWAMLVRKGAGVDWLDDQDDLKQLDDAQRQQLKIGIWDQGPTTEWIYKLGLIEHATPYPMMSGDPKQSPADVVGAAMEKGDVNVSFLWGPLAGYLAKRHPDVKVIPLHEDQGVKFDFQIAMAVRHGDERRLKLLDGLIEKNQDKINELLASYGVPLLELQIDEKRKDDDDD